MPGNKRDLVQVKFLLGFIVTVLIVLILKELRAIFLPLFISLLLYFVFNGVVRKLLSIKIPKILVLLFLLVFIFILFYFFGMLIYMGVSSFVNKFPSYSSRLTEMIRVLFDSLKIPAIEINDQLANFDWTKSINTITGLISTTFGSFATFLGNLVLVIIFLLFMLSGRDQLTARFSKAFTLEKTNQLVSILNSIENQVQHYLLIKVLVSLLTAVIGGAILWAGSFDFVIFSAVLIFVLNFIPNFGSIIATAFPIIMGLLKFGFSVKVLVVMLGLMLAQMIIGNVVDPKITGKNLNLSPIVILISLIFWGWTWGITGMILAVPIMSALKIIFSHIEGLKPLAELISAE